jgi:hemolysin activation/secretion protein
VFLLHLPPKGPQVGVDNLPLLSTEEFSSYIRTYLGQEITRDSLSRLIQGITDYAHHHGQPLVNVSVPPQNVADGDVHLVVVLGRYNLKRLIVANTEAKAGSLVPRPNDGTIIVDDEPSLASNAFLKAMTPYFGQPITDESVNKMVDDIDKYLQARGEILAHWSLPRQYVSTGMLRIGVTVGRYPIRRVIVAETPRAAQGVVVGPNSGVALAPSFPLFDTREFKKLVAGYVGTPISRQAIVKLRQSIVDYVKAHDRLAVSVPDPEVDLSKGELRLSVVIARYGQVSFRGNKWFSDRTLLNSLGFHQGDEIRVSELEGAVNRTNQSAFRHVDVLLNGTTTSSAQDGEVPIAVQENEVRPIRFSASYDDTGNDTIGNNHYTGAVTVGDLWGLDHQFVYQYTTTDNNREYESNYANYRANLPWHDYITVAASYTDYNAVLIDGKFDSKGDDVVLDGRYVHPIFGDTWSLELAGGFDYKEINSDLHFGTQNVDTFQLVDSIAQYTASATYVQHDQTGSWVAGFTLNGSPGNFNDRNTNSRFQGKIGFDPTTGEHLLTSETPVGGPNAEARYIYGTATLQRLFLLPADFQLLLRGQGQLSSSRLLSAEQMSIGGSATVRGYDERIESGDDGWQGTIELHSPAGSLHLPFAPKTYQPLQYRFLAFYDMADVMHDHPNSNDTDQPLNRLAGTGVGLRCNWASNFSLSADYGFQTESTGRGFLAQPNPRRRGHIQATISY